MEIEEKPETNKEEWHKIIARLESNEIQSAIAEISKDFVEHGMSYMLSYGYMVPAICDVVGSIYGTAYSKNNLTGVMYRKLAEDLYVLIARLPDSEKREKLWENIKHSMPEKLEDFLEWTETMRCPNFPDLSIETAKDFLDYLVRAEFYDAKNAIRMSHATLA